MAQAQYSEPMGFGAMTDKTMQQEYGDLFGLKDYDDEEGEFHMSEASDEGTADDYDS